MERGRISAINAELLSDGTADVGFLPTLLLHAARGSRARRGDEQELDLSCPAAVIVCAHVRDGTRGKDRETAHRNSSTAAFAFRAASLRDREVTEGN